MDLIGQLTTSAYGKDGAVNQGSSQAKTGAGGPRLGHDEIIGNAFIMLLAGHETTANAMHFTLIYLAANPSVQRKLQKDIGNMVGTLDPSEWDYESLVNPLLASYVGACMYETLRLLPAVVIIPKVVTEDQDQSLTIDGQTHFMPRGMSVEINAVGVSRNPANWPTRPSKISPGKTDIDDFVPERWFISADKKSEQATENAPDEEFFGGFEGRDTSAQLFRPARGAYIPFSEGARSCLGRRIAQVELIAALAVIFQSYSVELATDDFASEEEADKMDKTEKKQLYGKAQTQCSRTLETASSKLTLKLSNSHVPIKLVKRGAEKFIHLVD